MIRVFVVDDHLVVRRGLTTFFNAIDDIAVVGEADDGLQALQRLAVQCAGDAPPDVVLLDLKLPNLDGVETAREIAARFPDLRIVVITSFDESALVNAALAHGAVGYVLKDAQPFEVESAIRSAVRGEMYIDPAVTRRLAHPFSPGSGLGTLSEREREVLLLVAGGRSNRAIAQQLGISERTARTHVSNVMAKLHVDSRTQAALLAVREGLVGP